MATIASTGKERNWVAVSRRVIDQCWYGNSNGADTAPIALNNEYITAVNAAGTGTVSLLKATAAGAVCLGTPTQLGTTTTAALALGGGTSATPLTTSTADKNFIGMWTQSTATSGTSRGSYLRHYLAGAGGDGEAARIFGTVSDVAAANAHGAHISLSFGSTGSITGEGIACRKTLQIPNAAMTGGTYSSSMSEIWCDGSSSDPSGVTALSLYRAVLSGNSTGLAKVDSKAALISLVGNTIGSGKIMQAKTAASAVTHTLRINVNGTNYWLMVSDTQ